MQKKLVVVLAGIGIVVSLFKIQAIHYQKQIDKLQSELADAQIKNQILQSDLKECKDSIQAKHDKMFEKLLADFKNFKKGGK